MDGIPEWAEYFLGVNIQNFSSASNRFFSVSTEKVAPSAGFTGKSGIFWLPPRHNKQRDPPKRSYLRYFYHN
jgi:hypothetical protein